MNRPTTYSLGIVLLVCAALIANHATKAEAAPAPAPQLQSGRSSPGRGLVDVTALRSYVSGSASLTFGTIAGNGGCASRPIPVTGAVIGDRVVVGPPAELLTYSLAMTYAVTAADTVSIRLCNYTNASITPPSWTWNADAVKSF